MSLRDELHLEVATGLSLGAREAQEDSVLCDVPQGCGAGIIVLADGLGGHAGGAMASRIAVSTAHRELSCRRGADGRLPGAVPALLREAAEAANYAVLARAERDPGLAGMGTTLILAVVQDAQLFWLSVGDSPLYLIRAGAPVQLNQTHSLAPHLDLLVAAGEMDAAEAAAHPGRHCLTSALGTDPIERIDCPETPCSLQAGDTVLAASDGLLTLRRDRMAELCCARPAKVSCAARVARLLAAVSQADDEEQDNTSVALLRVHARAVTGARPSPFGALERLLAGFRTAPPGIDGARPGFQPARARLE